MEQRHLRQFWNRGLLLLLLFLLLLLASKTNQSIFEVVFIAFEPLKLVSELLDGGTLGPGFLEHVLENLIELVEFSRDVFKTEDFVLIAVDVKIARVDWI